LEWDSLYPRNEMLGSKQMVHMLPFVMLVAFLRVVCDAATSDAQEEVCVEPQTKQLVQARKSLEGRRKNTCPWHMEEGDGCHQQKPQKALCKDGTYSWSCNKEGRGERQQCPCTMPYMCAKKLCGDNQDYCCEKTCVNHGGIRPCGEEEEVEPTAEPIPEPDPTPAPTPVPTPKPKACYAFARGVQNVLVHAGINVNGKSDDDKRNTCIVFNRDRSSSSTGHYQGMGTWENEGAAAAIITLKANGYSEQSLKGISEGNQRNTLITMTNECSGQSVGSLQGKKTLDIAIIMNSAPCCP